jgi:regulator of protease activity HflC (stomatin/prohibitin superfamily)
MHIAPGDLSPKGVANGSRRWFRKHGFGVTITTLLLLLTIAVFWNRIVYTVRPGEEAVMWKRLAGTQINVIYKEGTHVILPWDRLYIYDLRIQTADYTVPVLSTDGLEIMVDVTVRYHPESKTVPQLHQEVGPEYAQRIVIPEVVTAVREVIGRYRPEQLYTLRTDETQRQIVERAAGQARERFVQIDDVLIRRIALPESVQAAIQRKLNQEQEALEYEYRLEKERREALRKDIEADGIVAFQTKVAGSITPQLLQWKGVEATLELARSPNAKMVVVGGRDGLPLILNTPTLDGPAPQ